jgi:hypothetical protein
MLTSYHRDEPFLRINFVSAGHAAAFREDSRAVAEGYSTAWNVLLRAEFEDKYSRLQAMVA